MNRLLPTLAMPEKLISMINSLIENDPDGQYLINLNNTGYNKHGGVGPYQITVKKLKGYYQLLVLTQHSYFGVELCPAVHLDLINGYGFLDLFDKTISYEFNNEPDINNVLIEHTNKLVQYYEAEHFDLSIITRLL